MESQAYKVVSTHAHEISGWKILYIIIHSLAPHLGGVNGDVQSDIATLAFKNGEQIEYFIAEFSDFNRKLSSLEKLYLLQDFSSST